MWWMLAAQAGMGLLQGLGDKQMNKIKDRTSKVNAEAANKVRAASNAAKAAEGGLARWTQSLNNQRRLTAGGQRLEANTVNYQRERDAGLTQNFSTAIAQAEQSGQTAALAAANGVAGDTVDWVNSATRLRNSIVNQAVAQQRSYKEYDYRQRAAGILQQTVSSLDNSLIFDALDYGQDTAQKTYSKSTWQQALSGFQPSAIQQTVQATGNYASSLYDKYMSPKADTSWSDAAMKRFGDVQTPVLDNFAGTSSGMSFGFNMPTSGLKLTD